MLAIACHALDIGSMSSIFWSFEERENIMEFYERVSGARMHAALHKVNFSYNLEIDLLSDILNFIKNCYKTLNEMHNVLTYNKIWKKRLINIGNLSAANITEYSLTGVMARGAGFKKDIRLSAKNSYSGYNSLNLKSFVGVNGDCYDRYLIRMLEMGESLNICNTVATKLAKHYYDNSYIYLELVNNNKKLKKGEYYFMEDVISHFMNWHTGLKIPEGLTYNYIESPKGEFGVILASDSTNKPKRCKIRSPSYFNLQALPKLAKGHFLADLAALIGTIDIVFGEIDR